MGLPTVTPLRPFSCSHLILVSPLWQAPVCLWPADSSLTQQPTGQQSWSSLWPSLLEEGTPLSLALPQV